MKPQTLLVAVLTYRRPATLKRGLATMLEHVTRLAHDADRSILPSIVVIDNDPAESAKDAVIAFDSELIRYVSEPVPGISAGRNRALDEAAHHDLLVFIDDDEEPQEDWLEPLLDTWRETRPAAVMGRVVSQFEAGLDPWIAAGAFFRRRRMPTGTVIPAAAAGNLLLDMHQVRKAGVRFNDRFGLTGGGRTLFSAGCWCGQGERSSGATNPWPPILSPRTAPPVNGYFGERGATEIQPRWSTSIRRQGPCTRARPACDRYCAARFACVAVHSVSDSG